MSDKVDGREVHPMVLELPADRTLRRSRLYYPVAIRRRR